MQKNNANYKIRGLLGICGGLEVFLGFAPADKLHSISFADVLNEDTGEGYQRQCNRSHSIDFRRYITKGGTSTIPLTFNLRKDLNNAWKIHKKKDGNAVLEIKEGIRCLAQVDCQHRLSELSDITTPLAFMAFIGLDYRTETALFYVINSKARGLSSSLTDYHESNLINDMANEAPHLYIARRLNEDPDSPWFRLIKYGGNVTSGPKRRTSLRMMQRALSHFIRQTDDLSLGTAQEKYDLVATYWKAVKHVFPKEWRDYRHHLITKGLGVYSLTYLLADILRKCPNHPMDKEDFVRALSPLKDVVDWHSNGMFSNVGGHKGAIEVHRKLKRMAGL